MMNKKDIVDIGFIESIGTQIENLNDELSELQYDYVLKKLEIFVCSIMNATLNNEDLRTILMKDNYLEIHPFKDDNIIFKIIDFYMNDYNFESTNMDNNSTRYTFEYLIEDSKFVLNDNDKCICLKGRFDCILSIDFRDSLDRELYMDDYKDSEDFINNTDDGDHFLVSTDSKNLVVFNQYLDGTKDPDNSDIDINNKRVALILDLMSRLREDYIDAIQDFEL